MCIEAFAEFLLYAFFFFDWHIADSRPSCLELLQLLQSCFIVIGRNELFYFFQKNLFQFQVFFLFGVNIF